MSASSSGVHATCCICTEHYDLTGSDGSSIAVIPCGHTFHHHCLLAWMDTKLNCPECRKAFRRNSVIDKLYFNLEEHEVAELNPATLKNEVDSLKCQLTVQEREKQGLVADNDSLLARLEQVKEELYDSQQQCKEERNANRTLTRELKFHKSLEEDAEAAKREAYRLEKKLKELKSVDEILKGNQDEIEERLSTGNKEQLATFAVIIRKELELKKNELKTIRNDSVELKKLLLHKKKQLSDRTSELKEAKEKLKLYEQDLTQAESKNDRLRQKISALEKALGSPSDSAVSFASRLIHESPAPFAPSKRPKLTSPDDNFTSPELPTRLKSGLSTDTDSGIASSVESAPTDLPVTYLNFSNMSQQSSSRTALKDPSNIANVSGLGGFNLFKKGCGSGLMQKGSGNIRTGYNGMGGHEKHVEGSGRPFAKVSTTSTKRKNVFAKSKTGKTPALPTLDNFLG